MKIFLDWLSGHWFESILMFIVFIWGICHIIKEIKGTNNDDEDDL